MISFTTHGLHDLEQVLRAMRYGLSAAGQKLANQGFVEPTMMPNGEQVLPTRYTLHGSVMERFQRGGPNAYGGDWAKSTEKYRKMKAKRGGGSRRGIWAGSRRALIEGFQEGSADHVREFWARGFLYENQVPWAGAFVSDGEWGGEPDPARDLFPTNRQLAARKYAEAHLNVMHAFGMARGSRSKLVRFVRTGSA